METGKSGTSILAQYGGARPRSPDWFDAALARAPERSHFTHDGLDIELLVWGEVGRPGLLFLHGDSAHADWWSFIAPFFSDDWRCAAISWSGMGSSSRRVGGYRFEDYAGEAIAAIDAAKLDAGTGVRLVGHSLGGHPALMAAALTDRIAGVVTIDSILLKRSEVQGLPRPSPRPHPVYPTQPDALARFRFMPPTIGKKHYLIDHVARTGLMPCDRSNGEAGWVWRFDPEIWRAVDRGDLCRLPAAARCPLAIIVGARSEMVTERTLGRMRQAYPAGTPIISIPEAGHHVMIDAPLSTVSALRAIFAFWQSA
jgi:pimeloyl-ACP methyl ester carboxylesterase